MNKIDILNQVMHPYAVNDFIQNNYGKQHLHLSRNDMGFYKSLFTVGSLDSILSNNLLTDKDVQVAKLNSVRDKKQYCVGDTLNNESYIDVGRAIDLVNDGYSIVIDNLAKFSRQILDLEIEISKVLGYVENISTNLYMTPSESQAFPMHYDTQEIFVLQISGKKIWEIHEETKELYPVDFSFDNHLAAYKDKEPQRIILNPGDLLYLPRGAAHKVYTGDETSLHLTISIFPYTYSKLINDFFSQLTGSNSNLRKNITDDGAGLDLINEIVNSAESRFIFENAKAKLKYKNKYGKLSGYTGAIYNFFDDVNLSTVKVIFRKGAEIGYNGTGTTITYGERSIELEGDFSMFGPFIKEGKIMSVASLSHLFETPLAEELIYVFLKDGFVQRL